MLGFDETSEATWEEKRRRSSNTEMATVASATTRAAKAATSAGAEDPEEPADGASTDIDGRRAGGGVGGDTAKAGGEGTKALSNILCCLCGRSIQPNGANMCGACLKDQVDVTEGIPKKGLVIIQCRRCLKWLTKNDNWNSFELESALFLAMILKKIPGIVKQEVVDAKWVWTEPHSKRLKVNVTVRKEVLNKVMLQQDATVEFVVHNRQCSTCNKEFTSQTWKAVVQVRQKTSHKRTMLLLEQQILKADAQRKCIGVESVRGGMDVLFGTKHEATEFVSFLGSVAPIRSRESTKLVSTDNHSNVRNSQHSIAVDIPVLCRDDLVALPRTSGNRLQGSLCLVHRITSVLQFVKPSSGETAEMTADKYWRAPTEPLLTAASLVEFVVLDCEPSEYASRASTSRGASGDWKGKAGGKGPPALWDIVVALASEVGNEDHTFSVTTILEGNAGIHGLEAGDTLLGYDLRDKNFNEVLLKSLSRELPDIILVKRAPPPKAARSKQNHRKVRSMEGEVRRGEKQVSAKEALLSGLRSEGEDIGGRRTDRDQQDEAREAAALMEDLSLERDPWELLEVVEEEASQEK